MATVLKACPPPLSATLSHDPVPSDAVIFVGVGGRVLLRKLWTKMAEPDWRTVSKAVYMLQRIVGEMAEEQHAVLRVFLSKVRGFNDNEFLDFCHSLGSWSRPHLSPR